MYNITNKKLGEMSTSEEWTNEYRRGKPFPEWRTSLNIIDDLFMGSITDRLADACMRSAGIII